MNIYEYAKSINYGADYYEPRTGYIYHIQEYGEQLKNGEESPHFYTKNGKMKFTTKPEIRVSKDGKTIGYAEK